MNKFFKKTLIGLAAAMLVLLLAAVVIAAFFQDAVGKKLIAEINKQLETELKVGGFELSLIKDFPNATASLHDVVVTGKFGAGLLEAQDMAFHFRLLSLFSSQVKVRSVGISDGALYVHIDKRGKGNFEIFKPTETTSESNFNISLKKAKLDNIELSYQDDKLRQEIRVQVEEAVFSGELSNKKYNLHSTAKLASNFIDLKDTRYFAGKKWGYDADIFVDLEQGQYDFKKVKVLVEDNIINLTGAIKKEKSHTFFDLVATTDDADLGSVIALLPEKQLQLLGGFSSRGKFHFSMDILGKLSAHESPSIESTLIMKDGQLAHPMLKEPMKEVSFEAGFTNGAGNSMQTSFFEIKNFKGYLHHELLTMHLKIEDFDDPFVDFQADGALPVGYLYDFFDHPGISGGDGEIEISDLDISGLYRDMVSTNHIFDVDMSGELEFDDASLKINGEEMTADKGKLIFKDNLISLEELKLEGTGGDIRFDGKIQNLLPVLFADSINSKDAKLIFSGEMYAGEMDLAKLRKMGDVPFDEGTLEEEVFDSLNTKKYERREHITDFLLGNFSAKVDRFNYNKIKGKNFNGQLVFNDSKMRVQGNADGMDGRFAVDGTVFFQKEPHIEAKVSGDKIDVKKFFYQTENFGQDFLRHEHIEGNMNTKLLIHAYWDSTGVFISDKLHVWAGIGIQNGELKNFEILKELSSYVKVRDLRDVRFVDMQNWLEIKNSKFYLPVMFIQNNAMNMSISGEQTFDGKIDYAIKINAGQVLANKLKSRSNNKPIKAKKKGFFNLYFNVYGTLDDFEYETNKNKVKNMFAQSEKRKRRIRAALIKEFGAPLNMLREPVEWQDEGETVIWEDDDDVEYIDGF
ncbi:MAG TPA: hypothetical protein ENJ95_11815 [Bacteroidetes bacterium]|nr:hypothetical protein [Bacteroidota bacterium]